MVEQTLHRQRDRDDDGTNSGDDPRRSEFKRHSFSVTTHFSDCFSFFFLIYWKKEENFENGSSIWEQDKGIVLVSLSVEEEEETIDELSVRDVCC